MAREILLIQTTVENETDAKALARKLVEARCAACVQITPITSVYHWEGQIENGGEYRLDIKTSPDAEGLLLATLMEAHPYDTPEILLFRPAANAEYGQWAKEETSGRAG